MRRIMRRWGKKLSPIWRVPSWCNGSTSWNESARTCSRSHGRSKALGFVRMDLGILAMFQRGHQRAGGLFEESLALYKTAGSLTFTSMLLYFLSRTRLREGELTQARVLIEEVQALVR